MVNLIHYPRYLLQLVIDRYYWRIKRTASPARCSKCWGRKRFTRREEIPNGRETEVCIQKDGIDVHGIVRESWCKCPACGSTVWGGFDETVDGINWSSLYVFYGLYDELCEGVRA
jgi:hypothetical protein